MNKAILTIFDVLPQTIKQSDSEPAIIEIKRGRGRPKKQLITENIKLDPKDKPSDNNSEFLIKPQKKEPNDLVKSILEKHKNENKNKHYLLTNFIKGHFILCTYEEYLDKYVGYPIIKIGTEKDCVLEMEKRITKQNTIIEPEEIEKTPRKSKKKNIKTVAEELNNTDELENDDEEEEEDNENEEE